MLRADATTLEAGLQLHLCATIVLKTQPNWGIAAL